MLKNILVLDPGINIVRPSAEIGGPVFHLSFWEGWTDTQERASTSASQSEGRGACPEETEWEIRITGEGERLKEMVRVTQKAFRMDSARALLHYINYFSHYWIYL